MRRGSAKGRVMLAVAVAALVLGIQQEPTRTSASMTDMVGRSWLAMSIMDADARVWHVVTGGERRKSGPRFIRAFALRGGAWISEEEEAVDKAGLEHADEQDVQAMTEDALDAFVEQCAQEATKTRATGGEMNVPPDMPYEDFVWTREFAEQGFDPLFMTGMTEEQAECARKEWISRIMDGEDDADQLSEHYKNEGNRIVNEARKIKAQGNENYTKLHSAAIQLYTDALRQNASSIVHRAVCHANRANSHLERSNFGHAIRDCNATLAIFDAVTRSSGDTCIWVAGRRAKLNVDGEEEMRQLHRVSAKSAARAARACLRLNRFKTASHFCCRAMEIQARSQAANLSGGCNRLEDQGPGSVATDKDTMGEAFVQSVRKMREEAEAGVALRARAAARIAAQSKVVTRESFMTRDAVRRRGVLLGAPLYPEVLTNQGVAVNLQKDEASEAVVWPMLLIYPEHGQSDFLRQCSEDSTIHDHLLAVMDPELAPAPWDPGRTLTPSSVSVYFISNQVPVQHEGRWCWLRDEGGRRLPKEWIKVESQARVGDLVRMRGHVVGQFPVLHVVASNSSFETHMLASDPTSLLPPLTVPVHDDAG